MSAQHSAVIGAPAESPATPGDPVEILWAWLWAAPRFPHASFLPWGVPGLTPAQVLDAFDELVAAGGIEHRPWCFCSRQDCTHDPSLQLPFLRSKLAVLDLIASPPAHWQVAPGGPRTPAEHEAEVDAWHERWAVYELLEGRHWLRCVVITP